MKTSISRVRLNPDAFGSVTLNYNDANGNEAVVVIAGKQKTVQSLAEQFQNVKIGGEK